MSSVKAILSQQLGDFPEYFRRKKIKFQNFDAELHFSSAESPEIFKD